MWLGQAYSDNLPSLRSTVPIQYNLIQVVKMWSLVRLHIPEREGNFVSHFKLSPVLEHFNNDKIIKSSKYCILWIYNMILKT